MHEHDLDLIASYADGSLDDPAPAAALVDSCERCAAEYDTQRFVIETMSSATIQPLTEFERARLHREVMASVESRRSSVIESRGATWWERYGLRVASVAAVLFVGVGVVGVVDNYRAGNDTAEFTNIASGLGGGSSQGLDTTAAADTAMQESAAPLAERTVEVVALGEVDRAALDQAIADQRTKLGQFRSTLTDAPGTDADDGGAEGAEYIDESAPLGNCELPPDVDAAMIIQAELDGRPIAVVLESTTASEVVALWTDTCDPADLG